MIRDVPNYAASRRAPASARGRTLVAWSAAVALLLAWVLAAPGLEERLIVSRPLDRADAIVVLAGSGAYASRVRTAAALYRNGASTRVVLTDDGEKSGWSAAEQRNIPFVELARRALLAGGVRESDIEVVAGLATGTAAEARLVAGRAAAGRWRSLLLVTSATHTRRALWTFERAFAARGSGVALGVAAAPRDSTTARGIAWWLAPGGWRDVGAEYVKIAYYRLAY